MNVLIALLTLFAEPAALNESVWLLQSAVQKPIAQAERSPRPRPSPDRGAVLAELLAGA